jgi:hypothetical protein
MVVVTSDLGGPDLYAVILQDGASLRFMHLTLVNSQPSDEGVGSHVVQTGAQSRSQGQHTQGMLGLGCRQPTV